MTSPDIIRAFDRVPAALVQEAAQYQAANVITSDMAVEKLVTNIRNPALNTDQQRKQLDLLQGFNQLHARERHNDGELESQIKTMETAFRMQREAMDAFAPKRSTNFCRCAISRCWFL